MTPIEFDAVLQRAEGQDAAWFEVPVDVRATFGRARPRIIVTVNGYTFQTTVASYGGRSLIGVNKAHRRAAGIVPGQKLHVTIARAEAGDAILER